MVGSEYRKIEGILRECEGVQEGVRLGGISIKVEREGMSPGWSEGIWDIVSLRGREGV